MGSVICLPTRLEPVILSGYNWVKSTPSSLCKIQLQFCGDWLKNCLKTCHLFKTGINRARADEGDSEFSHQADSFEGHHCMGMKPKSRRAQFRVIGGWMWPITCAKGPPPILHARGKAGRGGPN